MSPTLTIHGSAREIGPTHPAEHPLEGDGVVQVAADAETPLLEGVDSRQLALAKRQPGGCVGGDRDIGSPAGDALAHPGAVRRATHLPRVSEVAQLDVIGRVETRVGPEVPVGQRAKCRLDLGEAQGVV
jgi:hypothetical protein